MRFGDLWARGQGFAADLQRRGLAPGDRVLIAMPVGPDLYAALAGLWQAGGVAVFPEPALGLKGLRHAVRTTRPRWLCATGRYRWLKLLPALWSARLVAPGAAGTPVPVGIGADDPALLSFTSGSTGAPKCIQRSHGFLAAQQAAVAPLLRSDDDERDLTAFPVFVLVALAEGRTSVLPDWTLSAQDRVTGAALAGRIRASGATRALLPPALVERLAGADWPEGLSTVFTGGGPVFPDVLRRVAERARVVAVYGSTEAEPIAEIDAAEIAPGDWEAMAAGAGLLVGRPVPQIRLRLVDDEVLVAGPHVNEGYLDPAQDAANKLREGGTVWHRTGDAGRLDPEGRLWLLGRHGSRVRQGEGWLYPFQVETAARLWPGVRRAALVDLPDGPALAVEGDAKRRGDWPVPAGLSLRLVDRIPMDARHASKVDLDALRRKLVR